MKHSVLSRVPGAEENVGVRVGFLSTKDPMQIWSWSGALYFMYRALEAQGLRVAHVTRSLLPWSSRLPSSIRGPVGRVLKTLSKVIPKRLGASGKRAARIVEKHLLLNPCDVIFAPAASVVVAHLRTSIPIVYLSDTTFRLTNGHYGKQKHSRREEAYLDDCDARTIARASQLVYFTQWAAESAVRDYGADPSRVHVIPGAANIVRPANLDAIIADKNYDVCRLLFIGKDWERKGGDIAVDALDALVEMGIDAALNVCSAEPSARALRNPRVVYEGLLNKGIPAQAERYERLLRDAHVMLLPTRADCGSFACLEAAAYGVPSLTTDTGGVAANVLDGKSGHLLSVSADGREYARIIAELWNDRERYANLVDSTRAFDEGSPGWHVWGEQVGALVTALARPAVEEMTFLQPEEPS